MFRTGLVLVAALLAAQTPDETAFKKYVDGNVGGVWTATDSKGNQQEARWEWILDKKFARLSLKDASQSFQEIHGIDSATGKWTYWGFDNSGRTWKGVVTMAKADKYTFEDSGNGPKGIVKSKGTITVIGPNAGKWEYHEWIIDGQKQTLEKLMWNRKK